MNTLRLENINLHSPYRVWQTKNDSHYYFQTDSDIQYDIVFSPDASIINSGAYSIDIINRQHVTSHVDIKLRQTITAIIEEFFEVNGNEVMLYITETGDGKQMFRNRLFVRWFNMYNQHDKISKSGSITPDMLYTDDGFDNVFGTTGTEPAEPVTDTEDVPDVAPETTGAPETDAQPEKKSGDRTALIVAIVAGVTVLAGAGVFLLIKKKK